MTSFFDVMCDVMQQEMDGDGADKRFEDGVGDRWGMDGWIDEGMNG